MSKASELKLKFYEMQANPAATFEEWAVLYKQAKDYCGRGTTSASLSDFSELMPEKFLERIEQENSSIDIGDKEDPVVMEALALNLIGSAFKRVDEKGTLTTFRVKDLEFKEVQRLPDKSTREYVENMVARHIKKVHHTVLRPIDVNKLFSYWKLYADPIPQPIPFCPPQKSEWCFYKARVDIVDMPTPTWDAFLARCGDPEALLAYIYGNYAGVYKGRQVFWFHGEEGEEGKSFVSMILMDGCWGGVDGAVGTLNNAQLTSSNKQFLTSSYVDKAIIYYGDCNNRALLFHELFKMISAGSDGDTVTVEHKGRTAVGMKLDARCWVNSNYPPLISSDRFIRSRILYTSIAPLKEKKDPQIGERFKAELPGLLFKAQQAYQLRCPDNRQILQNEETDRLLDSFSNDYYEDCCNVFDAHFEVGGERDCVSATELAKKLQKSGMGSKQHVGDFKKFLQQVYDISRSKTRPYVYRGMKLKGMGAIDFSQTDIDLEDEEGEEGA